MTSQPASEPLTDAEYESRTRATLAAVEATVDRLLEDDIVDIDASRTGSLLELAFPDGSKIVINTQPPLQELWLASPAGGWHFKSVAGRWVDGREGGNSSPSCRSAPAGRPGASCASSARRRSA